MSWGRSLSVASGRIGSSQPSGCSARDFQKTRSIRRPHRWYSMAKGAGVTGRISQVGSPSYPRLNSTGPRTCTTRPMFILQGSVSLMTIARQPGEQRSFTMHSSRTLNKERPQRALCPAWLPSRAASPYGRTTLPRRQVGTGRSPGSRCNYDFLRVGPAVNGAEPSSSANLSEAGAPLLQLAHCRPLDNRRVVDQPKACPAGVRRRNAALARWRGIGELVPEPTSRTIWRTTSAAPAPRVPQRLVR